MTYSQYTYVEAGLDMEYKLCINATSICTNIMMTLTKYSYWKTLKHQLFTMKNLKTGR